MELRLGKRVRGPCVDEGVWGRGAFWGEGARLPGRTQSGTRLYLGSAATVRRTVLLLTDSPQKGAWGLSVSGTQDKQRMPVE